MKRSPSIEWVDVPSYALPVLKKRVGPLIDHYANNIRAIPLEQLAWSCYSQGLEDGARIGSRGTIQPADYQI
jgi:hypothetical protein